jgi:hypothetical protein
MSARSLSRRALVRTSGLRLIASPPRDRRHAGRVLPAGCLTPERMTTIVLARPAAAPGPWAGESCPQQEGKNATSATTSGRAQRTPARAADGGCRPAGPAPGGLVIDEPATGSPRPAGPCAQHATVVVTRLAGCPLRPPRDCSHLSTDGRRSESTSTARFIAQFTSPWARVSSPRERRQAVRVR